MLCTRGKVYCFICITKVKAIQLHKVQLTTFVADEYKASSHIQPSITACNHTYLTFTLYYNLFIYAASSYPTNTKSLIVSRHKTTLSASFFQVYIFCHTNPSRTTTKRRQSCFSSHPNPFYSA